VLKDIRAALELKFYDAGDNVVAACEVGVCDDDKKLLLAPGRHHIQIEIASHYFLRGQYKLITSLTLPYQKAYASTDPFIFDLDMPIERLARNANWGAIVLPALHVRSRGDTA
jgi:hypothetical protein